MRNELSDGTVEVCEEEEEDDGERGMKSRECGMYSARLDVARESSAVLKSINHDDGGRVVHNWRTGG